MAKSAQVGGSVGGKGKKSLEPPPKTRYVASAPSFEILPETGLPEFAFIGRSNVGKSSLLQMLLKVPKMVRVSRTPGRTQALNLFVWDEKLALVDLPGYGYAKLPLTQRDAMNRMIKGYLQKRGTLRGVVLLVDARRDEVSDLDLGMRNWIAEAGRPLLLAITKTDLIPKNRLKNVTRSIERALGVPQDQAIVCSVKDNVGRGEILKSFVELST